MRTKRDFKSFDYVLFLLVCLITIFGIIVISSSDPVLASKQRVFFLTGIVLFFLASFIDFNLICKFYIVYYIINLILLILVLRLGSDVNSATGTDRWLDIGSFQFQPSESSKLFLIIFLAKYIDDKGSKINNIWVLLSFLMLTMVPFYLILKQPALSASLVTIAIMVCILFVAKLDYKYILAVLGIGIPFGAAFYYDAMYNNLTFVKAMFGSFLKGYHFGRIESFILKEPTDDLYRQTYNSLLAIGSGKLYGKGLNSGQSTGMGLVVNNENDFIMSIIGEEFGFIGTAFVIILLFLILIKCLLIANNAATNLGKYLVIGIVAMFAFQAFFNICVATDLSINTGIAYPFVSYGGTGLWVYMVSAGLVCNVGMEKTKSFFEVV